jgi:uncharacterized repeat protein (TIGR02543 family)
MKNIYTLFKKAPAAAKLAWVCAFVLSLNASQSWGQTYYNMSSGNYSQNFTNIANTTAWPNGFNGTESQMWRGLATNATGSIPSALRITTATNITFRTGTTGGVQRGSGVILLLSTGATNNSSSAAIELYLNFTGRTAGSLTFNAAQVANSTGNRVGTLRVYASVDGTTYTELSGGGTGLPYSATNNVASSAAINVSLPASFNNAANARLRFYYHNGSGGSTGSRPKISIDNISVTSTATPTNYTVTFNGNGNTGGSMSNQTASSATNLTTNTFTRTGYTFTGWNTAANGSGTSYANGASFPFTANTTLYAQWTLNSTPTLSANTLTAFGSQCINNTYGPNSFTITGTALTTATVTVASLSGYTFSTTSSGTYTNSLSLSQSGGAYSQQIFVRFSPTAATTYNGNIVVGGGGATSINVAASGSGINGTVAVTTTVAGTITTSSASSGGTGVSTTCGTITAKGVVWGATANPTTASNLGSTSNGTGTGNFTSSITGLSPNTTYHYRAYATNSNGITSYGTNLTFTTLKSEPTNFPTSFACGTTTASAIPLTWADATGATIPDGYLIKWSSTSYGAIAAPVDGTAEANGATTRNVAQGVQTYTASGLSASTTYFFKIWSYTNSGSNINYKLVSEPQTTCATTAGPCFSMNGPSFTPSGFTSSGDADAGGSPTTTIRLASASTNGSITTTATGVTAGNVTLTFRAKGWSSTETSVTVNLGGSIQNITNLPTSFGEITLNFTSVSANPTLTFSTIANKRVHIGNVNIFCTPACTAPTQASAVTTNTPTTGGFSMGWTAGSGSDGTMLVVRPTAQANEAPTSGTTYTPNLAWASAALINSNTHNRVVHRGTGTTAGPVTGLTAETQYTITAYAYNNTDDCYNLTSPPSATRWTLSSEPTAHASTFTSVAAAYDQVNLTYTTPGSGADGYVILRRADGVAPTTTGVVDAVAPASWSLPVGTVIANANATGTGWNNTGLAGSTTYCYLLIPFNWNGSNAETYNYRIAATVPTTCSITPATPSNESNVVDNTNYATGTPEFNSNINYINFIDGTSTTTGKMIPMKLKIQDGGNDLTDADNFNTELTGIKFTVQNHLGANQLAQIKTAILTTTGGTVIATATKVGSELVFSGMSGANVTAFDQDNSGSGEKIIHLRVSFDETQVIDNTKLVFQVSSVTAGSSSSIFTAANGGGATTDANNTNDRNRIEVTADRLAFVQQPTNTSVSANMSPSVTVSANDLYNRRDLDFTSSISITSTGTLSSSPQTATAANGLATFSAINHTAAATGRTLTAERNGSGDWDVTSNTFAIINCTPPIWEENFDYGACDVNDIVDNTTLWTEFSSTSSEFKYNSSAGLSYTGYPSSGIGGSMQYLNANGQDIRREISSTGVTSGELYSSFLLNMVSASTVDYFFSFMDNASPPNYYGRVNMRTSGSGFQLGVQKFTGTVQWNPTVFSFNTTYLVVVKNEFVSGSTNDVFSMWVFNSGVPATEALAGTPIQATTSDTDPAPSATPALRYIALRQTGKENGFVDGIRVATSWESLFCGSAPTATTYTWTGTTSSAWSTSTNWSPEGVPAATDNIIINSVGTNKLSITDCRSVKDFTLNGTGNFDMTVNAKLTITGNVTYDGSNGAGSSSNLACASQAQEDLGIEGSWVYITNTAEQVVPALNYANLDVFGGNRIFPNGLTIGICGRFLVDNTKTYTVTGSTVNYFSALSGWIMTPFTYYNLTFSGIGDFSIGYSDVNADKTINVLNDYTQSAGTVYLGENSIATATLNVDGNMTISGGTFEMNYESGGKGVVNLKGDLSVATGAILTATTITVSNTNFNFTGTYNPADLSTIQTVGIASTGTTRNQNITFTTKTGAYSQLSGSNLELGSRSLFSVEAAATHDFGFNGTTALILTQVTGASPAPTFAMTGNATIVITHPNGIDRWSSAGERAIDGNVQVSGTRSFSTTGTYHYKGKGSQQRLGDGILFGGISGKHVIVELEALATQLLFEGNSGTSTTDFNELTNVGLSSTGNGLKIIQGTVVGTATSDFMSTGKIEMTGGLYKIAYPFGSSDIVPRLSGTYTLTGGTIELIGSSNQVLRGGNAPNTPNYFNLKLSGGNNVKINNTPIKVVNKLEIVNSGTTFDVESNTMDGNAGVTMTDGLLRFSKLNSSLPELEGINTSYSITGGTIEFYGSGATQIQRLRGTDGNGNNITYHNIEINAAAMNLYFSGGSDLGNVTPSASFAITGTLNVNKPASFRLDFDNSISGSGNFVVNDSTTLFYASPNGIKTSGIGVNDGNIRISGTRTFSQNASYGFTGGQTMVSGNALPSQVINLYTAKNIGSTATLLSPITVKRDVELISGTLNADGNNISVGRNWTNTGATYTHGNNKVIFFGNVNSNIISGGLTIGKSFFDVDVDKSSNTVEVNSAGNTKADNLIDIKTGILNINSNHTFESLKVKLNDSNSKLDIKSNAAMYVNP